MAFYDVAISIHKSLEGGYRAARKSRWGDLWPYTDPRTSQSPENKAKALALRKAAVEMDAFFDDSDMDYWDDDDVGWFKLPVSKPVLRAPMDSAGGAS
jgi:hypothetical protein